MKAAATSSPTAWNDPTLAEYARPGGLRSVNGKGYADWSCLLGFFCEVHDNGEIWANVLWDARERFRADNVRGSAAAGSTRRISSMSTRWRSRRRRRPCSTCAMPCCSPKRPRNPLDSSSANFCRLWESFAGRGMGVGALDTADSG